MTDTVSVPTGARVRVHEPRRLALIGCGQYAQRSHLQGVRSRQSDFAVTAVIELPGHEERVKEGFGRLGLPPPDFTSATSDGAALDELARDVDGVVISSPPVTHRAYLARALAHRLPVLIDKPVIVAPFAATRADAARGMVRDFERLCAAQNDTLVVVAAQRRYSPIYRAMGKHLHRVHSRTGFPVTFVQALTNDGLWYDPRRDADAPHLVPQAGGGKLINTGYHVLDIVPWMMRHCRRGDDPSDDVAHITQADVTANFYRAADSAQLGPHRGSTPRTPLGNEINAALQVAFRDADGHVICLLQVGALHEGLSARTLHRASHRDQAPAAGRNKQDLITIYQGPAGAVWMRRIAKLRQGSGSTFGGEGHVELVCAENADPGIADGLRRTVGPYRDADDGPIADFLNGLATGAARDATHSGLRDHGIAMRLLAAAYASATDGPSETVPFSPDDWALPVGAPFADLDV